MSERAGCGDRIDKLLEFFGFLNFFCNAVRNLRMEKVETLVVTVPMASPKNPPRSEKGLEARRRLQAPGGVPSRSRTR